MCLTKYTPSTIAQTPKTFPKECEIKSQIDLVLLKDTTDCSTEEN